MLFDEHRRCHTEELFRDALVQILALQLLDLLFGLLWINVTHVISFGAFRSNDFDLLEILVHVSLVASVGVSCSLAHLNLLAQAEIRIQVVKCILLAIASRLIQYPFEKLVFEFKLITALCKQTTSDCIQFWTFVEVSAEVLECLFKDESEN